MAASGGDGCRGGHQSLEEGRCMDDTELPVHSEVGVYYHTLH